MENQAADQQSYEDVQKSGYLRKQKSMHRRFFVLRAASEQGPSRLEYYENEKKFRSKSPVPKKALNLETCFNINKRADSKNKHMIVLYTRGESFAIAAENEEVQNEWYQAMLDLQSKCKSPEEGGSGGECDIPSPGSAFKEVWQVKVWPKGLGQARNLVGIYRLCLTDKTVNFVKLNSDVASVVLQLMNVRRCGHSENFFFIEVGRSAMTGPGEFWMQVDDSVVAQHMHETLLEAMKALSEEFRQRSKSQSVGASCGGTASNPISVPSRRHNPNLPPSQVGFSRRVRTETPGAGGGSSTSTSPTSRHGFPRARTASIGGRSEEGGAGARGTWASSSPSLNGSCSTTPTLRTKPTRAPTPAKITLSLARYTPNPAPSPVPSLSSSSGHGSEYGLVGGAVGGVAVCSFTRIPQRVSVSCSPSDYGSSDEYGSSPGEHSLAVPSLHGGSNGGLGLHAHGEGSSSYIIMGQREALPGSHQRHHGRRILRRSSSRECEAERRLLSKRASLPLASHERLAPHRKEGEDEHEEEYAVMSRSKCREPFVPHQGPVGLTAVGGGHQHESGERADTAKGEAGGRQLVDSGYMSMLPGVTAPPALLSLSVAASEGGVKPGADDEYMAMTPNNSVSPPQHMGLPASEGYMVMSPSSSCSPDLHGVAMWESRASVESRAGSDYMNMSPISVCSACSTPPSHPEQHPLQPKTVHSYFSLPRSYQHTLSTRFEDDLGPEKGKPSGADHKRGGNRGGRVGHRKRDVISGDSRCCPLSLSSSSFSSSSASSESLDDKSMSVATGRGLPLSRMGAGHRNTGTRMKDGRHQLKHTSSCKGPHQPRKGMGASSDMTKANTLPKVKESLLPTVPPSPGEYVSILYRGGAEAGSGGPWGPEHSLSLTRGFPRASPRPALCQDDGSNNLPRSFSAPLSTSSEYVTMDLGSIHHMPVQSSFSQPRGPPPAISPKARAEHNRPSPGAAEGHSRRRTNSTMAEGQGERLTSFTDYTDMAFRRGLDSHPQCPNYTARTGTHKNPTSSMEDEGGSSFTPVKSFSSPDRTSRTRGDGGRRRHRSETFKTQPSLPLQSSVTSSIFLEGSQAGNRRHGLDASLRDDGPTSMSPRRVAQTNCSAATEQGLNYIDLDLDHKDNPQAGLEGPAAGHSLFTPGHGGESAGGNVGFNLNTYARIDFYKSEELRAQHTNRTDDSDC